MSAKRARLLEVLARREQWRDDLHDWAPPREARQSLSQFIRTYNERRLHEALGDRPPAEVYVAKAAA